VLWQGPRPEIHSYRDARISVGAEVDTIDMINPAIPKIEAGNGVGQALVFIRKVDPELSKPWDIPAPQVLAHDNLLHIRQIDRQVSAGIVRRGSEIELGSTNAGVDLLRAEGSAFFTLAFPENSQPLARAFDRAGVVEFSSAVARYWARAWLLVIDHPYACITDDAGRFTLSGVPAGTYELVLWMPNWNVVKFDRDPELLRVSRVWHAAPLEKSTTVVVKRGERMQTNFGVGSNEFKSR